MTTKLIKKLTYLKDTTHQIKEALKQKGASIDETMPLRQLVQEINSLKTGKNTKHTLASGPLEAGEKRFIVNHFNTLEHKKGSLTGAFNGYFSNIGVSALFCYNNHLIVTSASGSNNWRSFSIDEENKIFTPEFKKTESQIKDTLFQNPVRKNVLGGFYFKEEETEVYPTGIISYPSGGANSSFNRTQMVWDSSGTYLINVANKTSGVDVLKLIENIDGSFAYELVQTIDTSALEGNTRTHSFAPADNHTPNSFCLFGRYIYTIDPATNALHFQDINQAPLPVQGVVLLYGKNYLVLKSDDTSKNPTITFLKATKIDASGQDQAFFENISNYEFEVIHQDSYQNVPTKPLSHAYGGYFSSINNVKDYFIRPLKESISSIEDFDFCFEREAGLSSDAEGLFYDAETFILKGGKSDTDCMCLYQKNPTTNLFEKENAAFHLRTYFLSEYGGGTFNSTSYAREYYFKDGKLDTSTSNTGGNYYIYESYMKNGFVFGYVYSGNKYYFKTFRTEGQTISVHDYFCNFVSDELICNLNNNALYKIENSGYFSTYKAKDCSFNSLYSFAIEKEGKIYAIHQNQRGVDVTGQLYQLTLDKATKTFTAELVSPIKCTMQQSSLGLARKVKTKPILLSTKGYCYGFYSGAEDGVLRFVEKPLPTEVLTYTEGTSISYIQTFYDGSVALQLANGKTLHLFLDFDEQTGTPCLQQGTTLDVFEPVMLADEKLTIFFSPFKRYQFSNNVNITQVRLSPFQATAPKEAETAYHLEPFTSNSFAYFPNASTCLATGKSKTLTSGVQMQEVEFG